MTNALRGNSPQLFAQHRANLAASLAHRLEVAKAAHNTQLIVLLEQEQRQLGLIANSTPFSASFFQRIKATWNNWMEAIANSTKLSVERIVDESGMLWWRAYDPTSGKMLYAETESEVLQWIEENNLGR